ncbi:hypothetical protein M8044_000466 [Columbia Basin potato purple top phytoplasma]|uniref:Lipoprotein n=1 Tax=Columbia Basin potato purple top phytoplasma TaxID=307134 RepID=A0ABT5L9R5_9MOLU|nr:hypothetical protein [Columbia Basin potato purple top phytoplasma]
MFLSSASVLFGCIFFIVFQTCNLLFLLIFKNCNGIRKLNLDKI